jgi:gas vesicle protein
MAPQSGEETRQMIRDKGIELRDQAVETAEEARHKAEAAAAEAKERIIMPSRLSKWLKR